MTTKLNFCETCQSMSAGHIQWMTDLEAQQHKDANLDHNVRKMGEN